MLRYFVLFACSVVLVRLWVQVFDWKDLSVGDVKPYLFTQSCPCPSLNWRCVACVHTAAVTMPVVTPSVGSRPSSSSKIDVQQRPVSSHRATATATTTATDDDDDDALRRAALTGDYQPRCTAASAADSISSSSAELSSTHLRQVTGHTYSCWERQRSNHARKEFGQYFQQLWTANTQNIAHHKLVADLESFIYCSIH